MVSVDSCSPWSYWGEESCGYPSHGGDCANFVSQCLLAGGHPPLVKAPCRGYPCGKEEVGAAKLGACLPANYGWVRGLGTPASGLRAVLKRPLPSPTRSRPAERTSHLPGPSSRGTSSSSTARAARTPRRTRRSSRQSTWGRFLGLAAKRVSDGCHPITDASVCRRQLASSSRATRQTPGTVPTRTTHQSECRVQMACRSRGKVWSLTSSCSSSRCALQVRLL